MFDTLTHLDFPAVDATRAAMVGRARAAGVTRWVVASTHPATWARTEAVAAETGGVAALGTHPWWAAEVDAPALMARRPVVIGEIGLDRTRDGWDQQVSAFREQLAVARALDCPVVLHVVRAWSQVRAILRADGAPRGWVHGWSGSPDALVEAEALGLLISFGPTVLQDRRLRVRASARRVSLDRLLLETDSPEHGELSDLPRVAAGVAQCRGCPVEEIAHVATRNAERMLGGS